jgi:3-dehydroquinate synthase
MSAQKIFLIGLSGAGKSTIGRLIAENLGWSFADSDAEIEAATARTIPDIFREEGEPAFRARELEALEAIAGREPIVVATGGGAPTSEACRRLMDDGFTVWLWVSPARAAERLRSDSETPERPLLQGDVEARLTELLAERKAIYQQSDSSIDVDSLTPEQAAAEVVHLWQEWREHERDQDQRPDTDAPATSTLHVAASVRTPGASYPIFVQNGALDLAGTACRDAGLQGRAFILSDAVVGPLLAPRVRQSLEHAGYQVSVSTIPAGEAEKTLATVETVYDWLIRERVERTDFLVCAGGGVVTDLGGFAAATCLRGIDFVHIPTTMLGMVDASVGGKTGVDHRLGKNMIGAFAQPRAVIIDPRVLESLPERQLRAGMAELIKHGFILDDALVDDLESARGDLAAMHTPEIIARSVAIKAAVVSEDEREAGNRTLLNYGHTIGHAIEAVTGYTAYLHGEAVAIGMRAAGYISREMGLLDADGFERQQALIRAVGLPEEAPGLDADAIIEATLRDKKVRSGSVSWVLLERIGQATVRRDVPDAVVRAAVELVVV